MNKIKISVVSYTNSLSFIYGLENSEIINRIDLQKDIPSDCAKKLSANEVDIGLIPVAALPKINNYEIISDFCIAAKNKVDSVFLFSDVELNKIETILLDYQSNTSNNLTKILAKNFWDISPEWRNGNSEYMSEIKNYTAGVVIGDRAFELKNKYKFVYDLSEEWYKFTKLPFVFALWVSNKSLSKEFINNFNSALNFGLSNIDKLSNISPSLSDKEFKNYIAKSIKYKLDDKKREAIDLYLKLLKEL
jgi:chorismate dehydratase